MAESTEKQLTLLLQAWSAGDAAALEQLAPAVFSQLRRLAAFHMTGERPNHVLQPSALVNEVFLRLLAGQPIDWQNRSHFFGFAARLMRQILVDLARSQDAAKRGNRVTHVTLTNAAGLALTPPGVDILDLDRALDELAQLQPRQARVVELRYFAGLENAEAATVMSVSEDTVLRDWRAARAWLYHRLHVEPEKT